MACGSALNLELKGVWAEPHYTQGVWLTGVWLTGCEHLLTPAVGHSE